MYREHVAVLPIYVLMTTTTVATAAVVAATKTSGRSEITLQRKEIEEEAHRLYSKGLCIQWRSFTFPRPDAHVLHLFRWFIHIENHQLLHVFVHFVLFLVAIFAGIEYSHSLWISIYWHLKWKFHHSSLESQINVTTNIYYYFFTWAMEVFCYGLVTSVDHHDDALTHIFDLDSSNSIGLIFFLINSDEFNSLNWIEFHSKKKFPTIFTNLSSGNPV